MKQYPKHYPFAISDVNKHRTFLLSQPNQTAKRATAGGFLNAGSIKAHVLTKETPHPDEQELPLPETYEQLDQFIDQCVHEWAQWLITTELRHSQMQYKYRSFFTPTDFAKITSTDNPHE